MHWQKKKVFDYIKSPWTGCFIFMRWNWNTVFFISPRKTFKNHLKTTSLTELFSQSVLSNVVVTFIFYTDWICYLVFFRSTLWRLFLGFIVEHSLPTNKTENPNKKDFPLYNQTMLYHPFLAFITLQTWDNIEFNTKVSSHKNTSLNVFPHLFVYTVINQPFITNPSSDKWWFSLLFSRSDILYACCNYSSTSIYFEASDLSPSTQRGTRYLRLCDFQSSPPPPVLTIL